MSGDRPRNLLQACQKHDEQVRCCLGAPRKENGLSGTTQYFPARHMRLAGTDWSILEKLNPAIVPYVKENKEKYTLSSYCFPSSDDFTWVGA